MRSSSANYCFEGRLDGSLLFRYESLTAATKALREHGVKMITEEFRPGDWKDLNITQVPKEEVMDTHFFDQTVAAPWLEKHRQPPSSDFISKMVILHQEYHSHGISRKELRDAYDKHLGELLSHLYKMEA